MERREKRGKKEWALLHLLSFMPLVGIIWFIPYKQLIFEVFKLRLERDHATWEGKAEYRVREDTCAPCSQAWQSGYELPKLLFAGVRVDQLCVVPSRFVVLANIFIVQIVLMYGNGAYAACLILYL